MKLLKSLRPSLFLTLLFTLGFTAVAKADVCFYDSQDRYVRGEIIQTDNNYNGQGPSAWVYVLNANEGVYGDQRVWVPFDEITNCSGRFIGFFPMGYREYNSRIVIHYDRYYLADGYYPVHSHFHERYSRSVYQFDRRPNYRGPRWYGPRVEIRVGGGGYQGRPVYRQSPVYRQNPGYGRPVIIQRQRSLPGYGGGYGHSSRPFGRRRF